MAIKAAVPIYVVVSVADQAQAIAIKKKLEQMLQNPLVRTLLQSNGIAPERIVVGDPLPTP
jgi:hypothetical protein